MIKLTKNQTLLIGLASILLLSITIGKVKILAATNPSWEHYNARVLNCDFPVPLNFYVSLRAIEHGSIDLVDSQVLASGSITISRSKSIVELEESTIPDRRSIVKAVTLGPLLVQHEEVRVIESSPPSKLVLITDGKDKVVLMGTAYQYWEDMVDICLNTME